MPEKNLPVFFNVLLAAALIFGSTNAHATGLKMTFAMPTTPAPYLLPFFVAKDLNWLAEDGLTVEEKVVTGDINCMRALIAGEADTTLIGPNTIMQAIVSGAAVKIVGSTQPGVDYEIVARDDVGNTIEALGDKKWAIASVGGMTQALPRMIMKKHGVDTSKVQYLPVGGQAARYQAIAAGIVDASLLDVQLSLRAESEGRGKVISAVHDDLPDMGYVFFPARTSALIDLEQRAAMQIFIRDNIRGVRYVMDHPDDAAKVLAKRMKVDDIVQLVGVLKKMNSMDIWGVDGGLNKEVLDFSQEVYRASGDVTGDVPYEKLVDASLVNTSLNELGKR